MGLEAFLGDSVVRLELDSHVVVLRSDDFRDLGATVFPMKLRVGREAAPYLHIVVFTHLNTHIKDSVTHIHSFFLL